MDRCDPPWRRVPGATVRPSIGLGVRCPRASRRIFPHLGVRSYYVSVCHAASRANVRRRSSVRRRARRTPRGAPARGGGPVASGGMACKRRSGRAEPERDHQPLQIRSSRRSLAAAMRRTHGRLFTGASPVVQGHPNRSQFLQSTYDNPSAIMT